MSLGYTRKKTKSGSGSTRLCALVLVHRYRQIGAILVNINPPIALELEYALRQSECNVRSAANRSKTRLLQC